jgi:hypothetical protein
MISPDLTPTPQPGDPDAALRRSSVALKKAAG